jgi:hypothetical protein
MVAGAKQFDGVYAGTGDLAQKFRREFAVDE